MNDVYQAIVSAEIYINDNVPMIEIYNIIHDDYLGTGIFENIENMLLESVDNYNRHNFFALVNAQFLPVTDDFTDYDVNYNYNIVLLPDLFSFKELSKSNKIKGENT